MGLQHVGSSLLLVIERTVKLALRLWATLPASIAE
jgi:hypothetical protein